MRTKANAAHGGELVHGHSRLLWLIDEVDAHLLGLWEPADDNLEPIIDELLGYWDLLRGHLRSHMRHEENELFDEVERLAPEFVGQIQELRLQHTRLDTAVGELDAALRSLAAHRESSPASTAVRDVLRLLREEFIAHSRYERDVLREVEATGLDIHPHD